MADPKISDKFKNKKMWYEPEPFQNRNARLQKDHNWSLFNGVFGMIGAWFGDLEQIITDKITDLDKRFNDQMTSTTNIDEVIDARRPENGEAFSNIGERMNDSDERIKLMDISDEQTINQFLNSETEEVGGLRPDYYQQELEAYAEIPEANFNVGFITDNHHQLTSYAPNSLSHYANIAALSRMAKIDAIVAGGDNINGYYDHDQKLTETKQVTSTLFNRSSSDTDVFFVLGNHDTGIGQNSHTTPSTTLSEAELKDLYGANVPMFDETRDNGSLYGFKDYADNKVRLIWLNSYDLPWTTDENGNYNFSFLSTSAYRNEQLNWLANTALKLPDNTWQVMIFTHCPLPDTFETAVGQQKLTQYNSDVLVGVLNAFQNGVVYTHKDEDATMATNINVDFSTQGKGTLIGLFSGHIHADGQMKYQNLNLVETACSLCYSGDSPRRQPNKPAEDCWDVFSVDTDNRKIHAFRFGYGDSRDIEY